MEGKVDAYPTSEPVAVRDYISRLMPLTGQAADMVPIVRWSARARIPRLAPMAKRLARATAPIEAAVIIVVWPRRGLEDCGLVMT